MFWLVPLALCLAHGYAQPESSPLDLFYFGVTALFWIGHRLCSTWLAYCTEAYRPLLRAQPVRFVVLPLLLTVTCFLVFLPSDSALPWTREERLVALAMLDYALVTYHFAAQHFGALSLYRARVGRGAYARAWTAATPLVSVACSSSSPTSSPAALRTRIDGWISGSSQLG